MRVLLISPLDPKKPGDLKFLMGGENTYTRSLLGSPPKGVEYIYFEKTLTENKISFSFWQTPLDWLIKLRLLPLSPKIYCLKIKEKFDLIHSHAHALKLSGLKTSVILSDSSSNILFLRDYLSWPDWRIKLGYLLKKWLVKILNIYDQELNLKDAPLIVWSEFAKKVHQELGMSSQKIKIIPPGIEKLTAKQKTKLNFNILFIGVWFKRKGGELLFRAYLNLKRKYPQLTLTIVGQMPKDQDLPKDVIYYQWLPREKLLKDIFLQADVLVLVPEKAEGYGLVVLEAASLGIPSIVSSVYALSEIVENQKTGLVIKPGSVSELTKALETLIKYPQLRQKMGFEAKKRFLEKFWVKKTNQQLLQVYKSAIKDKLATYKIKKHQLVGDE